MEMTTPQAFIGGEGGDCSRVAIMHVVNVCKVSVKILSLFGISKQTAVKVAAINSIMSITLLIID